MIGKVAWEPMIGDSQPLHMEVFGIYRDFYDRAEHRRRQRALALPVGNHNADSGGGVGGTITWTAIPKLLDLQATAMTGSGIGRYGSRPAARRDLPSQRLAGADPGNHLPGRRHLACHAAVGHLCL